MLRDVFGDVERMGFPEKAAGWNMIIYLESALMAMMIKMSISIISILITLVLLVYIYIYVLIDIYYII